MESSVNSIYNKEYYDRYGHNVVPYESNLAVRMTLRQVADSVVKMFRPKTHLDVGCAMGFLVAEMRIRGVKSFGIEPSTYAVSKIDHMARPFVRNIGIFDIPESEQYDIVSCIEVLEHLQPEECDAAIDKLCSLSNIVIFSSEDNRNDPTHFNANPIQFWINRFEERGYVPYTTFTPSIPWGRVFVKAASYKELSSMYDQMSRSTVYIRDRYRCVVTGKTGVQVHEIIPRSAFGKKTLHKCFHEKNRVCLSPQEHEKAHTVEYRKMLLKLMQEKYGYTYEEDMYKPYL